MKGRVIYLLVIVIGLNLTYPISLLGTFWNTVYVFMYAAMLGAGVYVASVNRQRFFLAFGVALITAILGAWWVLRPDIAPLTPATYLALIVFQAILIVMLIEFIFHTKTVTRNVLYAAITVYLLLGDIFIPTFMTLETFWPGSFVASAAPEVPVTWQQMAYFSYITLTTLGYGDILPVSPWAQSLSVFEAMVGVLYIAILIGRLVGLYAQEQ